MDASNHPNFPQVVSNFDTGTFEDNNAFANSLGVNLNQIPQEFIRSLGITSGYFLSDSEIQNVLNSYTFESNTNSRKGELKAVKVRKDDKERKTNRNRRLETLNLVDGLYSAAQETQSFYDAAGLRKNVAAEKMNLEPNQPLHPLGFGAANALFFDEAKDAISAMEHQAAMASALAYQLNLNVQRAKQLISVQSTVSQIQSSNTSVPMSCGLRSLMNQSKMKLETFCIGASSWCSGMYLPKLTMCLNTAMYRPQARSSCQTLLKKLDAALIQLDKEQELDDSFVKSLDEAHAGLYNELRRSGLVAVLSKQMRGAFGARQKREDHQHSIFVTASLREQLYYYISTAPMQIGRRMCDTQFPLPRLLVAAERFIDTDVNGTVDAFRLGGASNFIPPNPMEGPQVFEQEQFDGGGSISLLTCKTLRPEFTGIGVKETEYNLETKANNLVELGKQELQNASKVKFQLNILNTSRTNEDRCFNRELSTNRDKEHTGEKVDFIRQGSWIYITEHAPVNVARELVSSSNKISPFSEIHATSIPGNFILPESQSVPMTNSIQDLNQSTSTVALNILNEQQQFLNTVAEVQEFFNETSKSTTSQENVHLSTESEPTKIDSVPQENLQTQVIVASSEQPAENNISTKKNELENEEESKLMTFCKIIEEEETEFHTTIQSSKKPNKVSKRLPLLDYDEDDEEPEVKDHEVNINKNVQEKDEVTTTTNSKESTKVSKKRKANKISTEEDDQPFFYSTAKSTRQERLFKRKFREDNATWIGEEPDVPEKFRVNSVEEDFNQVQNKPLEIDALKSTIPTSLPSNMFPVFTTHDYSQINGALLTFFKENAKVETTKQKTKEELLSVFVKQFILDGSADAMEEKDNLETVEEEEEKDDI
jgi:hypothetical protein